MATCSLLRLLAVYYVYLQSNMATCSLLCLPIVYYDYTYSLPSVLPIGFYMQLLYYINLVFIITTSVLLSLLYLLS